MKFEECKNEVDNKGKKGKTFVLAYFWKKGMFEAFLQKSLISQTSREEIKVSTTYFTQSVWDVYRLGMCRLQ